MKYEVTLDGLGAREFVTVEAASGDEAAARAWKVGTFVTGVHPVQAGDNPRDVVERRNRMNSKAEEQSE